MPDAVKPRRYDNSRRSEAARATRRAVVAAARELFLDTGYPSATLMAIARAAGVSVQTVYAQFGTKRAVLKEVVDQTVAGDDDPRPLAEREGAQQLLAEPDPRQQLRLLARGVTEILRRIAPLDRMLRGAAEVDAEVGELRRKGARQRLAGMQTLASQLAETGRLRPDLTPQRAAERLAVLIDPELYNLVVVGKAWTPAEYQTWLGELMIASLLPTAAAQA